MVKQCWRHVLVGLTALALSPAGASAQDLPSYLRDRGTGMSLSQFGTYIRPGEVIFYPLYEYYYDHNLEYEPGDFGYPSRRELRARRYEAHEGILFLGYGLSENVAIEFEAGVISAEFLGAAADTFPTAGYMQESGINDVEGQIRWRWNRETATKPEWFSVWETVFPTGKKHSLIGTSDWELKFGGGLVKGLSWGTITARLSLEYSAGENTFGNSYSVEWLKRFSDNVRVFAMLEGSDDEIALVPELQWFMTRKVLLKLSPGVGVTSKATDFAPEIGLMFWLR